MTLPPRAVLVHRATELTELVARHGTRQQAGFFLAGRGRDLAELDARHQAQQEALATVSAAIPLDWRRAVAERNDLDRFGFGPEDVVIAVGQDGLVANVAKYLNGQPVIGINPEPSRNPATRTGRDRRPAGVTAGRGAHDGCRQHRRRPATRCPERGLHRPPNAPISPLPPQLCGQPAGTPVVIGDPGRHRHRFNGLVPIGLAGTAQPAGPPVANRPRTSAGSSARPGRSPQPAPTTPRAS